MDSSADWIERLDLAAHPEGGYYAETYTADVVVDGDHLPDQYDGQRPTLSSIYYLLEADDCSAFHRLASDELWHFYRGDPVTLYLLAEELETITLGVEQFQALIPSGTWFAAETVSESDSAVGYSLVGCDVSPGFTFEDFELATSELADEYPDHGGLIERLVL